MPKYKTTVDGQEVTFEAANDAAAGRYIDGQLNKGGGAKNVPADVGPGLSADVSTLLGKDDNARERVIARSEGRKAGTGQAIGAGVQQGVLRNFGDELAGVAEASGLPVGTPPIITAPVGAARLAYEKFTGGTQASSRYAKALERARGFYEGQQEAHPVATTGGEIVGGFAGPMPAGRLAAVGVGAADAALAGAGAGEDAGSRGTGAAVGGTVGGTLAAAIPFVGGQIAKVVRGVRGLTDRAGGIAEREGTERVANAMRDDLQRLTPEEIQSRRFADQSGQSDEKVLGDYGGVATQNVLRRATNESPDALARAREVLNPRYESQGQRGTDWWDATTGHPDAYRRQQLLEDQARRENHPRYQAAYNSPAAGAVWTPELETLTTSDAVRKAIRDTTRTSSDYAALAGQRQAPRNPFVEAADGTLQLPPGQAPTLPFWDHVQRNLRAAAEAAPRGGEEARRIEGLRRELNNQLDNAVPEFRTARAGAAAHFGAEDALEAGRTFLNNPKGNAAEARDALSRFSPAERDLFRDGLTDSVRTAVHSLDDGRDIAKLFRSPEMRERLVLGLGPSRAAELQGYLRVERGMNDLRNALSNSTTAQQLIGAGAVGGALGAGSSYLGGGDVLSGTGFSSATVGAIANGLLKHGNNRVNEAVSRRVGELLMSQNPDDMRRVVRMMHAPAIRSAVEGFFDRVAAVTGQQVGVMQGRGPQ